jgi:hypothetical protein
MSSIEDSVCKKVQERAEFGLIKYGVTLADPSNPHTEELAILRHAQAEAMDLANYLEVRIQQIEKLNTKSEVDIGVSGVLVRPYMLDLDI